VYGVNKSDHPVQNPSNSHTHLSRDNILQSSDKPTTGEKLKLNGAILQLLQGNFKKAYDSIGEYCTIYTLNLAYP
jgi:hypothetical protein